GMVDVIGDLEFAEVVTNTGTIHADVNLDSLMFSFLWEASRPRYLSDVELPPVKEGHGGRFTIVGTLGQHVVKLKHRKNVVDATPAKETQPLDKPADNAADQKD